MNNAEIAKCLAEVSALVAAGHPYDKCVQSRFTENMAKRLGIDREWREDSSPLWKRNDFEFRVAKGFVEGKPVFEGSVLYDHSNNSTVTIVADDTPNDIIRWSRHLSWTPPAPKVEIPEGFTEWRGGECPVAYDAKVTVIFRSGRQRTDIAHHLSWILATTFNGRLTCEDIIAYKIHKPTTFTLNGKVLPLPDCVRTYPHGDYWHVAVNDIYWTYVHKADADKVRAALTKLTEGL